MEQVSFIEKEECSSFVIMKINDLVHDLPISIYHINVIFFNEKYIVIKSETLIVIYSRINAQIYYISVNNTSSDLVYVVNNKIIIYSRYSWDCFYMIYNMMGIFLKRKRHSDWKELERLFNYKSQILCIANNKVSNFTINDDNTFSITDYNTEHDDIYLIDDDDDYDDIEIPIYEYDNEEHYNKRIVTKINNKFIYENEVIYTDQKISFISYDERYYCTYYIESGRLQKNYFDSDVIDELPQTINNTKTVIIYRQL